MKNSLLTRMTSSTIAALTQTSDVPKIVSREGPMKHEPDEISNILRTSNSTKASDFGHLADCQGSSNHNELYKCLVGDAFNFT